MKVLMFYSVSMFCPYFCMYMTEQKYSIITVSITVPNKISSGMSTTDKNFYRVLSLSDFSFVDQLPCLIHLCSVELVPSVA